MIRRIIVAVSAGNHAAAFTEADALSRLERQDHRDAGTSRVLTDEGLAWQSVSPSQMPPHQGHVAQIGSEEDVSDGASQGYGADQRIQADIAHHAKQCAGGHTQLAGFPDDIR
jgi:hypothetical protein